MRRPATRALIASAALLTALAPAAAASVPVLPGSWRAVPPAPLGGADGTAATWTGHRLIVISEGSSGGGPCTVHAAALDPATRRWTRLRPAGGVPVCLLGVTATWSGGRVLVWGDLNAAYTPATGTWAPIPAAPSAPSRGVLAWTGRELIGWGGGCCAEDLRTGQAYSPAASRWRTLPPAPLPPMQAPAGVWTGRELLVLGGYRVGLAGTRRSPVVRTAAAYDPARDAWRRLRPVPGGGEGARAVWAGDRAVVAGFTTRTGRPLRRVLSYRPSTDRWERLPDAPGGRAFAGWAWTGRFVMAWGGRRSAAEVPAGLARNGLAYDTRARRWALLPPAPVPSRIDPFVVWTGRSLLVWGGFGRTDGAVFTP